VSFTITDIQKAIKEWGEDGLVKLVENLTYQLREDTPKKTQWASTNWMPSSTSYYKGLNGTKKSVSKATQTGEINKVKREIRSGNHHRFYITNNVPYILALEYGGPKNVGAHFIDGSMDKAIRDTEKEMAVRAEQVKVKVNV
jgi:hypothetical protein